MHQVRDQPVSPGLLGVVGHILEPCLECPWCGVQLALESQQTSALPGSQSSLWSLWSQSVVIGVRRSIACSKELSLCWAATPGWTGLWWVIRRMLLRMELGRSQVCHPELPGIQGRICRIHSFLCEVILISFPSNCSPDTAPSSFPSSRPPFLHSSLSLSFLSLPPSLPYSLPFLLLDSYLNNLVMFS